MRKVEIRLVNCDDGGNRVEVFEGGKALASFGSWGNPVNVEKHLVVELPERVDIIVTRHNALVDLLKTIYPDVQVLSHATVDDIKGKHIIGVLPLHLAVYCASVTTPALIVPPEKRGKDLPMDDMIRYLQGFSSYVVMPYQKIEKAKEELKRLDEEHEKLSRWVSLDSEAAMSSNAWDYRMLVVSLIGGEK